MLWSNDHSIIWTAPAALTLLLLYSSELPQQLIRPLNLPFSSLRFVLLVNHPLGSVSLETAKEIGLDTTEESVPKKKQVHLVLPRILQHRHCFLAMQTRKWHSTNPLLRNWLPKKKRERERMRERENKLHYGIFLVQAEDYIYLQTMAGWGEPELASSQAACSSTAQEGASPVPLGRLRVAGAASQQMLRPGSPVLLQHRCPTSCCAHSQQLPKSSWLPATTFTPRGVSAVALQRLGAALSTRTVSARRSKGLRSHPSPGELQTACPLTGATTMSWSHTQTSKPSEPLPDSLS